MVLSIVTGRYCEILFFLSNGIFILMHSKIKYGWLIIFFSLFDSNYTGLTNPIIKTQTQEITKKSKVINIYSLKKPVVIMNNVKFRFSDDIYININELSGSIIPLKPYEVVNFNNINSIEIDIIYGHLHIETSIFELLFNRKIFNYPDAPIKNIKISIIDWFDNNEKQKRLKIKGKIKIFFWLQFEMISKLYLNKQKDRIIIEAEEIKSLGFPYIKNLLDLVGLKFKNLLDVPEGRGLIIKGNNLILESVKIFASPKYRGTFSKIGLKHNCVEVFIGEKIDMRFLNIPLPEAKNYLFISQGTFQIGKMLMKNADVQMIDNFPENYFHFYLIKYFSALCNSKIKMRKNGSLVIHMPDYNNTILR